MSLIVTSAYYISEAEYNNTRRFIITDVDVSFIRNKIQKFYPKFKLGEAKDFQNFSFVYTTNDNNVIIDVSIYDIDGMYID